MDRLQYFGRLKRRSGLHFGATAGMLAQAFAEMEEIAKSGNTDYLKLVKEAREDRGKQQELAGIRIKTVNNFLLGSANGINFFEVMNLGNDEYPYIQNTTRQEVSVRYIGQDGGIKMTQAVKAQDEAMVNLRQLATDDYEYVVMDLYSGNVKDAAMAQVDVSYDLTIQTDQTLWPLIKASIGNFVTTGPKHKRTYNPHSSVKVANLPTSNLLTITGNTSSTAWRKECMDAALRYCAAWGDNAFPDGPLRLSTIYMPSSDTLGMLDQITLTSFGNSKVEEIFENGYVVNYGGSRFTLVGDATLDPEDGMAYCRTNKPLGVFFTKTSMDRTIVTPNEKQNKESLAMTKVIGAAVPSNQQVNVIGIKYRS